MLATVDINEPIWDANVLAMLGLKPCKKSGKYRPDDIYDCYNTINHWYYEFKKLPVAKKWPCARSARGNAEKAAAGHLLRHAAAV